MTRSALVTGVVAFGILQVVGAPAQTPTDHPSVAPLWTVHIDLVQPDKTVDFERLNIAENQGLHAILRQYNQPIKPVYEIVTNGAVYMSMRPKLSFTEFDAPSTVPDSVSKLFSTVTDTLDAPIHAALKFHHNEIWRFQEANSYFPAAPGYAFSTPGYIQYMSEQVSPGMTERYGVLLDSLNAALKRISYPWCVLMFSSSYGDGAYKYLWQADSKEAFFKAGDRAAVLTAVFGKKAADQMLIDWQQCLAGSDSVEAAARRDFTDLPEAEVWPGLPLR